MGRQAISTVSMPQTDPLELETYLDRALDSIENFFMGMTPLSETQGRRICISACCSRSDGTCILPGAKIFLDAGGNGKTKANGIVRQEEPMAPQGPALGGLMPPRMGR